MQALIIAGGKGTRLASLTKDEIPKPMVCLAGKPLLQHTIERLIEYGIKDIFISVGHLKEKITEYFKDGKDFGVNISYLIENEPLGSGGALYYLKDKVNDDFLVLSGDLLFDIDVERMLNYHKQKNSVATLFTHPNLHPYDSDLVVCDKDNKVIKLDFKNSERNYYYKNNVNAGFFIFNKRALDYFTEPKKISMEHDFINSLILQNKNVFAYKSPEYVKDVGTEQRFYAIQEDFTNGIVQAKCLKNKQKAIFIDRDGVINKYKGFITNEKDIELTETAEQAIKLINQSEYLAIIVSNQPVIARGEATFYDVEKCFDKIQTLLSNTGAYVDGIYYCPHHPDKGFTGEVKELKIDCDCRKPKIGMLLKAQKDFNLDMSECYIIGDADSDVRTGINANIPQIKVKSDLDESKKTNLQTPTYYAKTFLDAVRIIIKGENK